MQKFRLDWNYHSSNIEGNSLTYGETKALILFGQTAQAKPLKDHLEVSGHDQAIKYIEEIVRKERPLNETFIRELYKIILKQPYQVDAITPDGNPTKKWVAEGSIKPLLKELENQLTKFDSLFKSRKSLIKYRNTHVNYDNFNDAFNEIYDNTIKKDMGKKPFAKIEFESSFSGLVNSGNGISVKGISFSFQFFKNVYEIKGTGIPNGVNKLYDKFFSDEEKKSIVLQFCNWQYNLLEDVISKQKN